MFGVHHVMSRFSWTRHKVQAVRHRMHFHFGRPAPHLPNRWSCASFVRAVPIRLWHMVYTVKLTNIHIFPIWLDLADCLVCTEELPSLNISTYHMMYLEMGWLHRISPASCSIALLDSLWLMQQSGECAAFQIWSSAGGSLLVFTL